MNWIRSRASLAITSVRIGLRQGHYLIQRLAPKSLMVRYTLALTALAALIAVEQVLIQVTLRRQSEGQRLMRLIDQQQLDVSRLAKAALATQLASGDAEIRRQVQNLLEVIEETASGHRIIVRDLNAFQETWFAGNLKRQNDDFQSAYHDLDLSQQNHWKHLSKGPATKAARYALRSSLQVIRAETQDYRAQLETLAAALDRVTQEQFELATRIEFYLFALLICVLLFQGFYIFRPSVRGLESALKTRSEFMSRMSHEIRNPMNAIMGMTDVLRETPLNELQMRYLNTLDKSSQTLLELLNSLLDFSALESGKTRVERIPFDLMESLGKVIDVSAVRAQGKGLEVILDIDPRTPLSLVGDPVRLQQVLTNLLSNAVKFTDKGEVRLTVRPELRNDKGQYLLFNVSDTGIGINTKSLARIFESFVQADTSTRRKYGGTGLGLTIAKDLVQLMGGQLSVTSEVGRGSQFVFLLPFGTPNGQAETLESRLAQFDLRGFHALCLGPMTGSLRQAANLIEFCGGRIESRIEAVDLKSPRSFVLISPQDDDSLVQFFPDRFPPTTRIICLLGTGVSAARMKSFINFGVTEFTLAPVKPLEFLQTVIGKPRAKSGSPRLSLPGSHGDQGESPAEGTAVVQANITHAPHERPLRVLIADDSAENRELIRLYLARENVETEFAADGAQAIQKIQSDRFDLVLMDIQMPVLDGLEAFASIRKWETSQSRPATPIIAVTADDRPEKRQELLRTGFSALLLKPLRKQQLISLLMAGRHPERGSWALSPTRISLPEEDSPLSN